MAPSSFGVTGATPGTPERRSGVEADGLPTIVGRVADVSSSACRNDESLRRDKRKGRAVEGERAVRVVSENGFIVALLDPSRDAGRIRRFLEAPNAAPLRSYGGKLTEGLDTNIVAVSLPAIGRSLGASFTDIEWVVSSYLLSYASLLMGAGAYADLQGRKKVMAIGLALFAISSGLCGTATSSLMLNTARALQGGAGALLLTAALAILSNTFTGDERTRAFAIWGACPGIALTSGPITGGYITNTLG